MSDPVSNSDSPSPSFVLPLFPLNTVVFPGTSLPLRVFEERYRALVRHLIEIDDPTERLFGTVAIRDGYEVGDHGAHSLYRTGVLLQLSEIEEHEDGTFSLVVIARDRIRIEAMEGAGSYPSAYVRAQPTTGISVSDDTASRARATFAAFRTAMAQLRRDPYAGTLPRDPEYLSWSLAAAAPLPLAERQRLLETDDASERIALVTEYLRGELEAIRVIPSLPATEVARTNWSPN